MTEDTRNKVLMADETLHAAVELLLQIAHRSPGTKFTDSVLCRQMMDRIARERDNPAEVK